MARFRANQVGTATPGSRPFSHENPVNRLLPRQQGNVHQALNIADLCQGMDGDLDLCI
ncbi:hypothetical protein [Candidatus Amarolinea dominans]|uniref:hypothetical protein n=1 Tax=Candidatus Amarolinea dominans TaxID=3140696 RepID=UPI0031CCC387